MINKNCLMLLLLSTLLAGCGEQKAVSKDSIFYIYHSATINKVKATDFKDATGNSTELSKTIAECALVDEGDYPCTLATLDFIGSESATPTKAQIMSKVIVSHQWMADRFSKALDKMPADMYRLFASTTAILIHANIRPAYFWSVTGAIYLDPDYLWQTTSEYNTISHEEDYRSDFGNELNYMSIYRYASNGVSAWSYTERTSNDVLYALSALLFHELAHARDQFSMATIENASKTKSPYDIQEGVITTSSIVNQTYPLMDQTLHDLAMVKFRGEAATQNLKNLYAEDVAQLFKVDGANDEYGYLEYDDGLHYEDTAMLFEEVMMKVHYNIDRELGFANLLSASVESCQDLSLKYTVINRYLAPSVFQRAELVVNKLLPDNSHSDFFANPPARGTYTYCVPGKQSSRKSVQMLVSPHSYL